MISYQDRIQAKNAEREVTSRLIGDNKALPRGVQKRMFGLTRSVGLHAPTLPLPRTAGDGLDAEQQNSRGELSVTALRQHITNIDAALKAGCWLAKDIDRFLNARIHLHNAAWLKEGDRLKQERSA